MTNDIDIYRAANEFIKRYGRDTTVQASMMADEMMARGSMEGRAMGLFLSTRSIVPPIVAHYLIDVWHFV